jgi:hypothetical protein
MNMPTLCNQYILVWQEIKNGYDANFCVLIDMFRAFSNHRYLEVLHQNEINR